MYRCALAHNASAQISRLGPDVDQVVGLSHDGGMMLDDHYGVTLLYKAMKDIDEFVHILLVEANGRFFDEVEVGINGSATSDPGASLGEL